VKRCLLSLISSMLENYLEVQSPKGLAANHLEKPDGSPPAESIILQLSSSSLWSWKRGWAQLELHSSALGGLVKCAMVFYILSEPEYLIYIFPPSIRPRKYSFQRPAPGFAHTTLDCTEKHTYMGRHLPSAASNFPIHWPVSTILDKRAMVSKRIKILQIPQKAVEYTEETLWFRSHKLTPATCEPWRRCAVK